MKVLCSYAALPDMHSQGPNLLPLLAYDIGDVDAAMDPRRDEGEPLLRRARALLRCATKTAGLETLLTAESDACLGKMLAVRGADTNAIRAVHDSILQSAAARKPRVCLLRPSVLVVDATEADQLAPLERQLCVPLKREARLARLDQETRSHDSTVLVSWPRGFFGDKQECQATLSIKVGPGGTCCFSVIGASGQRTEGLYARALPAPVLSGLLEQTAPLAPPRALRVPTREGELPEQLQLQIAAFAQNRLRAHVLASASAPANASRPVAFDNMRLSWRTVADGAKRPIMQVTAIFHSSSAVCFCGAHALAPVEQRYPGAKFTGVCKAFMTLEMCGQPLSAVLDLGCPTHAAKCRKNAEFAKGVCCSNLEASFSCHHEAQGVGRGLLIPCDVSDPFDHAELAMLLATAAGFDRAARPLLARGAPREAKTEMEQLVTQLNRELDAKVARFDMHALAASRPSDADLLRLDMAALRLLREGKTAQAKPREPKLVPRLDRKDKKRLSAEQKKLEKTHHFMFPRPGEPFGTAITVAHPVATVAPPSHHTAGQSVQIPNTPPRKRQCTEKRGYDYEALTEYMDPAGFHSLRQQLAALMKDPTLPARQLARGQHFQRFLNTCDKEFGAEIDGPLGLPARPLVCYYRARNDGGRLYPTGMANAPSSVVGVARSVCIQAAPREVRPFLCCRWARDFDMANAQPEITRQMPAKLTWVDGRERPVLIELDKWCVDRTEYIKHVADFHNLPLDSERHFEYRKDTVKELIIRLLFGGQYTSWISDICKQLGRVEKNEPLSPRVVALAAELLQLRQDVFESREWCGFVQKDRSRLVSEGKKEDADAVDRAVFARIAQKMENNVLTVMRTFLKENGWTVLTLCFDGVRREPPPSLSVCLSISHIPTALRLPLCSFACSTGPSAR